MLIIRSILYLNRNLKHFRTYLSDAYACKSAWDHRLKSPTLSRLKPRDFYIEVDAKFHAQGIINAVDIDIVSNTINELEAGDELMNILHRFRMTKEAAQIMDSTHHAVIRYMLENDTELLLEMLEDRLNYGIIPDYICYNLMMNKFIKNGDYASAARTACLAMLQEDGSNDICNAFALYSCHKYLEQPDTWNLPPSNREESDEEPIKIRVRYLRNEFFDDHFDLREPKHLVGKSLRFFGKYYKEGPLGRTCMLRGYILWGKYSHAVALINEWLKSGISEIVYSDGLELIKKELNLNPQDEVKELAEKLIVLGNGQLKKDSIDKELETTIKEAVRRWEAKDIEEQLKLYEDWEQKREQAFKSQSVHNEQHHRVQVIAQIKEDLEKQERLLTFFDNEEQIELNIEEKLIRELEKFGPPVEDVQKIEDDYMPPEIGNRPILKVSPVKRAKIIPKKFVGKKK